MTPHYAWQGREHRGQIKQYIISIQTNVVKHESFLHAIVRDRPYPIPRMLGVNLNHFQRLTI